MRYSGITERAFSGRFSDWITIITEMTAAAFTVAGRISRAVITTTEALTDKTASMTEPKTDQTPFMTAIPTDRAATIMISLRITSLIP